MYGAPAGYSDEYDSDFDLYDDPDDFKRKPETVQETRVNVEQNLYSACLRNDIEAVKSILDDGFDVDAVISGDWTPLLVAVSTSSDLVVEELLKREANVNCRRDDIVMTPLMAACHIPNGRDESVIEKIIKMLLEAGADAKVINSRRMNALMFAASSGYCFAIEQLLPICDKHAVDNQGWTALFYAIESQHVDAVKLLLDAGLHCDIVDVRGQTPLHLAEGVGNADVTNLLPGIDLKSYQGSPWNGQNYNDFFESGSISFTDNVSLLLYGMYSESSIEKQLESASEWTLFDFLHVNKDGLIKADIKMPFERFKIMKGLYRFHQKPFKMSSLPVLRKKDKITTANVAHSMLVSARQFVVMRASLRYLYENAQNMDDFRNFKKELNEIQSKLNGKLETVILKLNKRTVEWNRMVSPADLITKAHIGVIKKRSKFKIFCQTSVVSIIVYVGYKTLKKFL